MVECKLARIAKDKAKDALKAKYERPAAPLNPPRNIRSKL